MSVTDPPTAQVLRLLQGYWVSQTTAMLARLNVPDQLANGALSVDLLAERTGIRPRILLRLLRATAELGLVTEIDHHRYGLTELGECLRTDSPVSLRQYALGLVESGHWQPWGRFEEVIRTGEPAAPKVLGMSMWDYYATFPEEGEHFFRAMGELSAISSAEVTRVFDPSTARLIVDVGGAYGSMLTKLLEQVPSASGVLFDLPSVIKTAQVEIARSPVAGRITTVGGNFLDEVPRGGDLYVLQHILHDWDDGRAIRILVNCREAAAPQSRLLVVEMVVPEPWERSPVHLLDLNMMVMMGGIERTQSEFSTILAAAGWDLQRTTAISGPLSVLQATAV